jgi:hypothetical protein
MMEAADHRRLDDSAFVRVLHRSWLRGVLLQGEVGAGPVVVDEVPAQQATQMGFVQHHDVVETLAAEGADEPFHVGILPRRPRRRLDFVDPHRLRSPRERDPVHRIAIAQEVSRGSLPGERLHELLGRPLGGGGVGDWTTRRRSCARTTKTNKTLNSTVGTKKSTETRFPRWLLRKVRQVCDGGLRWRTTYLETAACEISTPSF